MADNIKIDLLINAAQSAKTIGETKKALKDLKSEALNLTEGSAAFTKIATAAGELQDKIGDLSATTKYLGDDLKNIKGITGIGEGIAGGFAMASGAAALFGGENKKLEESMVKLQAIMAVIQGMQAIGDVLQKQSAATLFIKNVMTKTAIALGYQEVAVKEAAVVVTGEEVAATVADTAAKGAKIVATEAEIVATKSATLGQKALNLAMKMNPIGILIALIIAGVSALMLWSNATSKSAEEEKKANEEKKKSEDLLKRQNAERKKAAEYVGKEGVGYRVLAEQLKTTIPGSKERLKLINQINSTYGSTLKNLKDEKAFQDQVNMSTGEYVKFLENKYKAQKNMQNIQAAMDQQGIIKAEIKAMDDYNKKVRESKILSQAEVDAYLKATAAYERKYGEISGKEQIKNLDDKIKEMAAYNQKLIKMTEDTGLKIEENTKETTKNVEETEKEAYARRLQAYLTSQEDLLKAQKTLSEQDKEDLKAIRDKKIDMLSDGYRKSKLIMETAAKDEKESRLAEDEKSIEEYKKIYERDVKNRMDLDKSSREQAIAAIKKDAETRGEVVLSVEELISKKKRTREEADQLTNDELKKNLANLEDDTLKKRAEDRIKTNKDTLDAIADSDIQALNKRYKEQKEGDKISGQEYLDELDKIEERKNIIKQYWEDQWSGASSDRFSIWNRELTAEGEAEEKALNEEYEKRVIAEGKSFDLLLEYTNKRENLRNDPKYATNIMTVNDEEVIPYDAKLTELDNLIALYKKKYGDITQVVTDANVKQVKTQEEIDKEKLDEKQKFWEEMVALEQQGQELMMSVFNNAMAQREATVNKEYDAKIEKIDSEKLAYDNLQANRTIQQQQEYDIQQGFENQKIEAQKVRDMELDKIKQKQFNAQKYNDMASIAINTALAVSKAVMASPVSFGMPWSGFALAMGIAQEATVASKQYIPAFAKGGIFNANGMVNGPGTGTSDDVNAKLSNGESVINAKSTKMFGPMLSMINQAGGGVAIPHLKNGGTFVEPAMQTQGGYLDTQAIVDAIYSTNERPIETYVSESSITTAQKNKQRLKGRTSF